MKEGLKNNVRFLLIILTIANPNLI